MWAPSEHADTLNSRGHLARAYHWGANKEAIAIFEPLLADRERVLGAEHPHTLTTRHSLALAYRAAGRIADAEGVRRKRWTGSVLTINRKRLGDRQ